MQPLLTVSELQHLLADEKLILLDASLPGTAGGKVSPYADVTLPGARFFDLKGAFSDPNSPYTNTVPSAAQFEAGCRKLGINRDSKLVIFDNMGIYSSPRVRWLFNIMGHDRVSVLDGGLPAWVAQGHPTVPKTEATYAPGNFEATLQPQYIKHYDDMRRNLATADFQVVDARSAGRFAGTAPEPRAHLRSGHMAGSVSLPYTEVLENGRFKTPAELRALFATRSLDERDLIFTCGSGLTACIVLLAAELAGRPSPYVYDGSWAEWAELEGLTVAE